MPPRPSCIVAIQGYVVTMQKDVYAAPPRRVAAEPATQPRIRTQARFEEAIGPQWGGLNIGHLYQILERLVVTAMSHARRSPRRPARQKPLHVTEAGEASCASGRHRLGAHRRLPRRAVPQVLGAVALGPQALTALIESQRQTYLSELSRPGQQRRATRRAVGRRTVDAASRTPRPTSDCWTAPAASGPARHSARRADGSRRRATPTGRRQRGDERVLHGVRLAVGRPGSLSSGLQCRR